jgi:hypothetical protein
MEVSRPDPALSQQRSSGFPKFLLAMFFLLFFIVGAIFFTIFSGLPLYRVMTSGGWAKTECTILKSSVKSHSGDSTTYSVEIYYKYKYLDKPYTSDRYSFSTGSSSGSRAKHEIVKAYPPTSKHLCFVNPRDPAYAVLNRNTTSGMYFGLITLVFVLFGGGGLIGVFFWKPKVGRTDFVGTTSVDPMAVPSGSDSTILTPEQSPRTQFLVLLGISLFWCGIVGVFTTVEIQGFMKGRPEWFLTIFMIPFQLIGIVLVVFAFLTFLQLFNPVPVLEVNSTQLALGDTLEVSWSFKGRTSSVSNLKLLLVGAEHATYRRGTSVTTDDSTFFNASIADVSQEMEIAHGSSSIDIPATTMHSFDGGNNKVKWVLRVRGEIANWPDIDTSFTLVLNPIFIG